MKSRVFAFLLVAATALPLAAQVTVRRWVDAVPTGPAHELANLNASTPYLGPATDLHLEFPIYSRATTGAAQLDAVLVYDSQFWGAPSGAWRPQAGNGWWLRTTGGHLSQSLYHQDGVCGWTDGDGDDGSGSIDTYSFIFTEPDGSVVNVGSYDVVNAPYRRHTEAEWNDCPDSDTLPKSWGTGDGKGFTVKVDTSGNGTAWDSHGDNVTNGFTDRNGNSVGLAGSSYYDPLGSTALTVSGSPATVVHYTYYGPGGVAETVIVPYESIPVTGSFGCYGGWNGSISVPSGITYPDGRVYSFTYDSAGRLATMTEPGGAVVTYSHVLGVQCSPFYISDGFSQTDSLDPGLYWSWMHNTSTNQTIQRSPYFQDTVTTFDSSGNPVQVDVHPGYWNSSGVISRTVYSGSTYNRTSTVELCVSTVDPCGPSDTTKLESQHNVVLDYYGNVTSTSDTDWGVNAPGSMLLRQTQNTYTASGNGEVPATAEVKDGSGNQAALTAFTSYDANGNPLIEHDYSSNTAYLTTSFTYNTNGTLATVTGPNGAVTSFTNYTCGSAGRQLFPQTVTSPLVGSTSATWDCTGGVQTSATDLNGQTTSTAFDNYWRPTTVTTPMGTTTISYPSVTRVERAMTFNGGASTSDVLTIADGLGRPVLQQTRQAPGSANFDTVQTTYDAMNRPVTVTMPYTAGMGGTAPSGTPYTQTWYDPISRPAKVVDGGGGEADYTYTENDMKSTVVGTTGAPTVSRQEEMDGLGRLRSVCELTAGVSGWPAGACGQTVAANGYLTAYTRSTLGQIIAVAQDSQPGNGGVENRSFSFDQLGRLTSENNPENGTVNYTFDTSSTCGVTSAGDLILRTDTAGNLTCYGHDALHRVTHIWYSGTSMNDKYFVYDAATVDGVAMQNVKGRLAEAHNGVSDLGFSYPNPASGEVYLFQQSPSSGGWYTTVATAYPNGATYGLTLPSGLAVAYVLDGEGRPYSANYGGSNALVTAAGYTALGPTGVTFANGDSDSFGYDSQTGRMLQYQFTVGTQTDKGVYTWNASGSQASLAITDGITGTADSQTCTYQHDDMGRLSSTSCGSLWGQTYAFDPFGNMSKTATTGTSFLASYNLKNQIASVGGSFTPNYDANGNLVDDPVAGTSNVNAFDLEGKATTLESHSGIVYDALGRVVEAGGYEFVYGPGGGKLAVMSGQTLVRADIPLPGGATAVFNASGLAYYQHSDLLGSARLASTPGHALYSSSAYAPFGENYAPSGATNKVFTGQHQDIDSTTSGGQDDFLMREYSATQSRWWTPDPAGLAAVDANNPQSWNRYSYAIGTPSEAMDPLGLWPFYVHNLIYGIAVGFKLDPNEMALVDTTSFAMDYSSGQQDPSNAYEHAMSDGSANESPADAAARGAQFINDHLRSAANIEHQWLTTRKPDQPLYSPEALVQFAMAVHTLTDSTSPAHAGFQPWFGGLRQDVVHYVSEALPYPTLNGTIGFASAVELASKAFNGVFPDGVGPDTDINPIEIGWACVSIGDHDPHPDCHYYLKKR